jgi:hypothetical protein
VARGQKKAGVPHWNYTAVESKYHLLETFELGNFINDKYHNDNFIPMFGKNKIIRLINQLKKIGDTTQHNSIFKPAGNIESSSSIFRPAGNAQTQGLKPFKKIAGLGIIYR